MRKWILGVLAVGLLLGIALPAGAILIPITATDGTWLNDQPPGTATIDNTVNPRTARWGIGVNDPNLQSGYNYGPASTPFNANSNGTHFLLGTFDHLNFPISGTAITSIELAFSMTIDALPAIAGTFLFTHEETPNNPPCAYPSTTPCADAVTISSPFLNEPFMYLGTPYFFTLLGFSQDNGVTTVTKFITQENQENVAGLYAEITETPVQIPEPATLLLLASGLAGLAGLAWRKN